MFDETTSGDPCKNVVSDQEDHCAAGHPCPPIAPIVKAKEKSVAAGPGAAFDLDDLVVAVPTPPSPEEVAAQDAVYAEKTAGFFFTDTGFEIAYQETIRGERPRVTGEGSGTFRLARFQIGEGSKSVMLANGFRGNGNADWYVEGGCTDEGCKEHAYVRLHGTKQWFGKMLPPDPAVRTSAFKQSVASGLEKLKTAKCDGHREKLAKSLSASSYFAGDDEDDEEFDESE
jgi:hypothetical protein